MKTARQPGLPRETVARLQALGEAIADVLEDDATPAWIYNDLVELTGEADNRASRYRGGGGARREGLLARTMFAQSVAIAEEGGADESEE